MTGIIERLKASDFDEAMDFLNLVFSQTYHPHDFAKLMPACYQPTDQSMQCNFAYKKDGRIRGIIGVFPKEVEVCGKTLKFAGIGGVATHANERGSGLMRELMSTCINHIQSEGYHLSMLAGLRQRYKNHGYEQAGLLHRFSVTKSNVKNMLQKANEMGIQFEKINENDYARIAYAKHLFDKQNFHCIRPIDEFYLALIHSYNQPWAVLNGKNEMIGYLVVNAEGTSVSEFDFECIELFTPAFAAWLDYSKNDGIGLSLAPWQNDYIRLLGEICERHSAEGNLSWMILDWVSVINAMLELKSGYKKLLDGEVHIEIKDYGVLNIKVQGDSAFCEKTNKSPDIVLDKFSATRLIFGAVGYENIITSIPQNIIPAFASWFPLPMSWLQLDSI